MTCLCDLAAVELIRGKSEGTAWTMKAEELEGFPSSQQFSFGWKAAVLGRVEYGVLLSDLAAGRGLGWHVSLERLLVKNSLM